MLPKEKKQKEEKTSLLGQAVVDLLPLLGGQMADVLERTNSEAYIVVPYIVVAYFILILSPSQTYMVQGDHYVKFKKKKNEAGFT